MPLSAMADARDRSGAGRSRRRRRPRRRRAARQAPPRTRPRRRAPASSRASLDRADERQAGRAGKAPRPRRRRGRAARPRRAGAAATATPSAAITSSSAASQAGSAGDPVAQQPRALAHAPARRRRPARRAPDRARAPAGRGSGAAPRALRRNSRSICGRQPDHARAARPSAAWLRAGSPSMRTDGARVRPRLRSPDRGRCRSAPRREACRDASRRRPSRGCDARRGFAGASGTRRSISLSRALRSPRPGARNDIASSRLVLPAPFGPVSTTGRPSSSSRRPRGSCGNRSGSRTIATRRRTPAQHDGRRGVSGTSDPCPRWYRSMRRSIWGRHALTSVDPLAALARRLTPASASARRARSCRRCRARSSARPASAIANCAPSPSICSVMSSR